MQRLNNGGRTPIAILATCCDNSESAKPITQNQIPESPC